MRKLSSEEQREIIDALTALELVSDLDAISFSIVSRLCNCPTVDAESLVHSLVEAGLIERISEDGERHQPGVPMDGGRWNWVRRASSIRYQLVSLVKPTRIELPCTVCKQPASFEAARKYAHGEYREPVCDLHAKDFASKHSAQFPQKNPQRPATTSPT